MFDWIIISYSYYQQFARVISLSFSLSMSSIHIAQYLLTYLLSLTYVETYIQTNFTALNPTPKQKTSCVKTLWTAGDSCVLFSYNATTRVISHWFSTLSVPSHLSGSQWCSLLKQIWFPTFVHLSFLRGPSKIALIPFTWENSDLHKQPPWRGKLFLSTASSKSSSGWHGNAVSHLHKLTTMFLQT